MYACLSCEIAVGADAVAAELGKVLSGREVVMLFRNTFLITLPDGQAGLNALSQAMQSITAKHPKLFQWALLSATAAQSTLYCQIEDKRPATRAFIEAITQ
ncbi:MAG: hypothetical protein JNK72_14070 [Myxococcales bacterium]|nr:hypothetical protein [Myxococcales bacterium]